jgi:hypothetical protein
MFNALGEINRQKEEMLGVANKKKKRAVML